MRRFALLPLDPEVRRLFELLPAERRPLPRKPDTRGELLAAIARHKKRRTRIRRDRRRREFRKRWMSK